jgi:hypothetical protein
VTTTSLPEARSCRNVASSAARPVKRGTPRAGTPEGPSKTTGAAASGCLKAASASASAFATAGATPLLASATRRGTTPSSPARATMLLHTASGEPWASRRSRGSPACTASSAACSVAG